MERALSISAILLSGGKGTRMKNSLPKQYLPLMGKPVCQYSFEVLSSSERISEIIIVCDKEYESYFPSHPKLASFAKSGIRRQDSVSSGLKNCSQKANWILIHDAARPLLKKTTLDLFINEALKNRSSALGVPVSCTIKSCNREKKVIETLDRSSLFEIQTPQMIQKEDLEKALKKVTEENLFVTDDLSLLEHLKIPTSVILGDPSNIKITYPIDLVIARAILENEKKEI